MDSRRFAVVGAVAAATLLVGVANASAAPSDGRAVEVNVSGTQARAAAVPLTPSKFVPVSPVRVLDTRNSAPVGPNGVVEVDLTSLTPTNATAVVLNVTGTSPTAGTFITVYPADESRPAASNLNLVAGQTRANSVTVGINPSFRKVALYNLNGNTHVVADLAGYYLDGDGSLYNTMTPVRALDTRNSGPVGPGGQVTLNLSAQLPASATAVTFNLTGVSATQGTFVTAYPTGSGRPVASSLNIAPGEIVPNQVTVQLGTNRSVNLFNGNGNVHLIADVAGYYAGTGNWFVPISPQRALDTREPLQAPGLDPSGFIGLTGWEPEIVGVAANLTGVNSNASQFITVWPGVAAQPATSSLNLVAGQVAANAVNVGIGYEGHPDIQDRSINFANNNGYVDVVFDIAGFFVAI
jgi:hypothetical protein